LGELFARGSAGVPCPLGLPEAECAVLLQAFVAPVQTTDLHLSLLVDLHRLVDPLARSGARYAELQRSACPEQAEGFAREVAGALGLSDPRTAAARGAVAGLLEDLLYDGTAADAPATTARWRARHAPLCRGGAEPVPAMGTGSAGQLPGVLAGFVLQLHSARAALLHANAGAVGAARAALRARLAAPEPLMAVATYLLLTSAAHRVLTYAAAALEGEGLITADIRRGAVHVCREGKSGEAGLLDRAARAVQARARRDFSCPSLRLAPRQWGVPLGAPPSDVTDEGRATAASEWRREAGARRGAPDGPLPRRCGSPA